MNDHENLDNLSTEEKLVLATGDVIVLLGQLNDLLAEGGEVERAVVSARDSFLPLFKALGIDRHGADESDEAASRPESGEPQAGPSSGRSTAPRAQPRAQITCEASSDEDEPTGADSSASPELTHHSFRGDSSFESQGANSAVAGLSRVISGSKSDPNAVGRSKQHSTTRPQPSDKARKAMSSTLKRGVGEIEAMKKVFFVSSRRVGTKQPAATGPKSVAKSKSGKSAKNESRNEVEQTRRSPRVSLRSQDSAGLRQSAPPSGPKARRSSKRPSATRLTMAVQHNTKRLVDVPTERRSSDKMDSGDSPRFSPRRRSPRLSGLKGKARR